MIREIRLQTLRGAVHQLEKYKAILLGVPSPFDELWLCKAGINNEIEKEDCDSHNLGRLYRALHARHFSKAAIPAAENIDYTLDWFDHKINGMYAAIEAQGHWAQGTRRGAKHDNCNPLGPLVSWLKDQKDMDMDAVLTPAQKEHLGCRAEKMGRK